MFSAAVEALERHGVPGERVAELLGPGSTNALSARLVWAAAAVLSRPSALPLVHPAEDRVLG
jgi:hypothetical protein